MKRRKPGRRRERNFSFGTGSRTEPEPSEPAAAVSDAVPLRAGQTNPIKARNRSPSTSPVHEAHSDRSTFLSDGRKRSDRSPVAAAARRTGPEQTGTGYLRNGPEFQR